jgi:hypothetical protein
MIMAGIPNGTNNGQWTSDGAGYVGNGNGFLNTWLNYTNAASFNWYNSGGNVGWNYKNSAVGGLGYHRCIYYPVDTTYTGPANSDCEGGTCFKLTLGNRTHMWFDSFDRTKANYITAFKTCNAKGGHLAHERDLTEAIRSGLPNGSNQSLITTDMESGAHGQASYPEVGCANWNGTDLNFDDLYSARSTWCGYIYNTANQWPYRCVWTDELR